MRIRVLGCGTSTGVPVPGCECHVCTSKDPRNSRLRTSAFLEIQRKDFQSAATNGLAVETPDEVVHRILIDTGPDLRTQLLREDIREVDAVLYTHTHADHIFGIDDLRGICFSQKRSILGFGSIHTVNDLRSFFPYIFSPDPSYMGGAPPKVDLHSFEESGIVVIEKPDLGILRIQAIPILHGNLPILGYRIGKFAYLTDCSEIPESSRALLKGLDLLFLSGLRPKPHPTHLSLEQAQAEILTIAPKQAYLIHLSHDVDYETEMKILKERLGESQQHIELAYDGLRVEC